MDLSAARRAAVGAAVSAGEAVGFGNARPVVLQDSNNVVVWLAPHNVVAKVGIWPYSTDVLGREVDVGAHLAGEGAPVAAPIGLLRNEDTTAFPVSLWRRLHSDPEGHASDNELAGVLRQVHGALGSCTVELPSFLAAIEQARTRCSTTIACSHWPRATFGCCAPRSMSWRTGYGTAGRRSRNRCTASLISATSS